MSSAIDILRGRGPARALLAAGAAALLALAACGGGGDRVSTFAPQRMVVLGDETSVIVAAGSTDAAGNPISGPVGSKYTVNAFASGSTTVLDCAANPLWVQVLAGRFGFTFAECNSAGVANPQARIYAKAGARVADLPAQVAAVQAVNGSFLNTDLVTVLIGEGDILAAYQAYAANPGAGSGDAIAAVQAAGRSLAAQVNGIANAGGRVLIATVPNLGASPYAAAQEAIATGRAALLTQLTQEFNAKMRGALINDGRLIGLVQADEQVQLVINNPSVFGYASTNAAACTTASVLDCTTSTLVSGATAGNFLWADDRHLNVDAQIRIGNLAVVRASNNPF